MLHCIEQFQGDGGDSTFADGFRVAEWIRTRHPNEWHTLTSCAVEFSNVGKDAFEFNKLVRAPTFG